ncbi:type III effector protein [Ralstonia syzygii]|uniref:Type III effector protein n=1 Tax=Ralstonia syzygii TaxID=28097 RepID=A0ABX7ZG38_9RALS|nr:NEL-type E3 ubiquitin ligase domain-containing protein [Ralstonia syzygii]QUP54014.1 type III effector protein [Ralstonia syzygii]
MPPRVPPSTLGRSLHVTGEASTSTSATATRPASSAAPAAGRSRNGLLAELPPRRPDNTPSVSAARVRVDGGAWDVRSAIGAMAALSSERETRLFKKSASKQYLYAKGLTAERRGQLELALERQFRNPAASVEARDSALTMWLSVQQARLRTHTAGHRDYHNGEQFETAVWSVPIPLMALAYRTQRRRYYSSPLRPEYRAAFNNFMRVIGDGSLGQEVRQTVAQRLEYHWHSEETIARHEREQLQQHGVMGLAEQRYRVGADFEHARLNAMERQYVIRREGRGVPSALHVQALQTELPRAEQGSPRHQWLTRQLREADGGVRQGGAAAASAGPSFSVQTVLNAHIEAANSAAAAARLRAGTAEDVGRQRQPLGAELKGWLKLAGAKSLPDAKAFDNEAYADAFARLLHRRRPWSLLPFVARWDPVVVDGAKVIHAIAKDAALRKDVFAAADTALGSCGDNVAEGFSNIVTMVDSHQLVERVCAGEMDQPKLESWVRQRYRLDSLVTEVNRLVERSRNREGRDATMIDLQLAAEPVETLLHAKVALKKELDLPKNIPSRMQYRRVSALKKGDLGALAETVRTKEANPVDLARYLLSNDAWRTAMQALHSAAFTELQNRFAPEKNALAKEVPPQPTDAEELEFLEERIAYAERTQAFTKKVRAAEDTLLLSLAGRNALVPAVVGVGPS